MRFLCVFCVFFIAFATCRKAKLYDAEQVRVTFGGNDDGEYVVSWVSFEKEPNCSLIQLASCDCDCDCEDEFEDECAKPRYYRSERFNSYEHESCKDVVRSVHSVQVDIANETCVIMRVSGDFGETWSEKFHLDYTVINNLSNNFNFNGEMNVAIFGDMSVEVDQTRRSDVQITKDANAKLHDFAIFLGDAAYNMADDCGRKGDHFLNQLQNMSIVAPIVYIIGNHESGKTLDFREYFDRISYGQQSMAINSNSFTTRYFAFHVGLVYYVAIDSNLYAYPHRYNNHRKFIKQQYHWLSEIILPSIDRNEFPWLIVLSHHAFFCTIPILPCENISEALRIGIVTNHSSKFKFGLESLFERYKVDVVFSGDTHHYHRTWPMSKGERSQENYINPTGIVHIQTGIAGVRYPEPFTMPQRQFESFRDESFSASYTRMTVHNRTHLTINQLFGSNGTRLDSFTLIKM